MSKEEKSVKLSEEKAPAKATVKGLAPTNELVFHSSDELIVKGMPFKIKEIKGAELVLIRSDIK